MGIFRVDGEVAGIAAPDKFVLVEKMLVDTGAEFSWIPRPLLEQAGVTPTKERQLFLTADGKTIARTIGYAFLRSSGFETVDEVVFGEPGDLVILGARTLAGFGAAVDADNKKLVAGGPRIVAPGGKAA